MKTVKIALILGAWLGLAACQSTPDSPQATEKPAVTEYLTQTGKIHKREINVSSEDWANAQMSSDNKDCWIGVANAKKLPPLSAGASTEQVLAWGLVNSNSVMAESIAQSNNPTQPCQMATNSNDVQVAQEEGKTTRSVAKTQAVENVAGKIVNGTLIGTGIREAGKFLGDLASRPNNVTNTTINADNQSSVEGAIGKDNSFVKTEQVSGILTETAPVNPITLDGQEPGEEDELEPGTPVVDFATCIAAGGDPVNTDGFVMASASDGIYSRCSDGSGGTITEF